MFATTAARVRANTSESVNAKIQQQTVQRVVQVAQEGIGSINRRLEELDQEWDIERYVGSLAPCLTLGGLALGLTVNRKWFALPAAVQAFFLQHALQGWCPPIPVLRALGIRTTREIDVERNALKALRGDYEQPSELKPIGPLDAVLAAQR